MGSSTIYVGLEIGTSKVCVVVGEARSDGAIKILGVGQQASVGVRKGEIVDPPMVQTCLQDALMRAEERSDVEINTVYLSITGAHVESFNTRGAIRIADEETAISVEELEEVKKIACDAPLPAGHAVLHSLIQTYYVDGTDRVPNPIGMIGQKLEADYHLIHGIKTRIQNAIRCVREEDLDVEDIVFAPAAAACLLLSREAKEGGVLLLDIGGGTTDYICYINGGPVASGCIPIGGEHITSDIAKVLKITKPRAEKLKIAHGGVSLKDVQDEEIPVGGEVNGKVSQLLLNQIMNARASELLSVVHKRFVDTGYLEKISKGIVLTGGTSLMKGIAELTEEIFGIPVQKADSESVTGPQSLFESPQCAVPIGIIKYAHIIESQRHKKGILKGLGTRIGKILGKGR